MELLTRIGKGAGQVVGIMFQAGRDAVDTTIKNVIPFMAFVAFVVGVISGSGLGDWIADQLTGLAGNLGGLLVLSIIIALPFLSPVLGPGAVIAQVIGVLIGEQIAAGELDPSLSLVALWAINPQVGCDFIPVGLALGEAEPETVEVGVPAVLFSRMITGPAAVLIAYAFSAGLYS